MLYQTRSVVWLLIITFLFTQCKKDDPVIPNEEELITTVRMTFTLLGQTEVAEFRFSDLDGQGGIAPVITSSQLLADTTYTVDVEFINEAVMPAESITQEVKEEAEDHQIFFQVEGVNMTFSYKDQDSNGNPLGLENEVKTGPSGQGTVTIILRHEPDKNASGVSEGNVTQAGGETDIEVTFPITLE